jgi:glycosyltransferase involved in cell wall biosynthesis
MISVIIPTFDDEARLAPTLASLVPAAIEGLVGEVVVADGGSTDATLAMADDCGARVVPSGQDLGGRLAAGCTASRGDWLLMLTPGVRLEANWLAEAANHMQAAPAQAGFFRAVLEGPGVRMRQHMANLRVAVSGRPYPEQGLLIARSVYEAAGGFKLRDDIDDLPARLGRGRLTQFKARVFVPQ